MDYSTFPLDLWRLPPGPLPLRRPERAGRSTGPPATRSKDDRRNRTAMHSPQANRRIAECTACDPPIPTLGENWSTR